MPYTIDRPTTKSVWIRSYLPEIARGMWITARHFMMSLIYIDRRMTIEYPEQKKVLPPGYRAEHRLLVREDGSIRCTACMLCATACPSNCITIEAEEVDDPENISPSPRLPPSATKPSADRQGGGEAALPQQVAGDCRVEKRPKSYVIDELRCVFCGLCVEACPCDAIRMDTGRYENTQRSREKFVYDKEKLLNNQAEGQSRLSAGLY